MSKVYVVIENKKDWGPYYPSGQVLNFDEYYALAHEKDTSVLVINLCRSYRYLSRGYYTSLLAEARGHRVLPSVKAINDLSKKAIYGLQVEDFEQVVQKILGRRKNGQDPAPFTDGFVLNIYFGRPHRIELSEMARKIFEAYPFPILQVKFELAKTWHIDSIRPVGLHMLQDHDEDLFAEALDQFHKKIWRRPRAKKKYRYDLAILVNPEEKLPPSNKKALKNFIRAAQYFSIQADLIERRDLPRLAEYDGLFIRETTAINHHTYVFARKAESMGMVVMDDPTSILRCANKVFLHDLLANQKISIPKTLLLEEERPTDYDKVATTLGFPLVLKIPDGSFSLGIYKVHDLLELKLKCSELFEKSVLILAQEYMFTDYDWRVGVIGGRPLFTCRYYMSKGHWQIYNHGKVGQVKTGHSETLPVQKTPKDIIRTALKACAPIGNGLYGVDIKIKDGRPQVIEVNDNPNIDAGVEDAYLGEDLYHKVMEEFYRRLEQR